MHSTLFVAPARPDERRAIRLRSDELQSRPQPAPSRTSNPARKEGFPGNADLKIGGFEVGNSSPEYCLVGGRSFSSDKRLTRKRASASEEMHRRIRAAQQTNPRTSGPALTAV